MAFDISNLLNCVSYNRQILTGEHHEQYSKTPYHSFTYLAF